MQAGIPLEDADRWPWLDRINQYAREKSRQKGAVIACSALKRAYRARLESGLPAPVFWFYLQGSFQLIRERMQAREGHFMPSDLLRSQFDILEEPEGAIFFDISCPPNRILSEMYNHLS
jgi:carbohydrate kinase (thermoresistant glucokinase family)